MAIGGTNRLDGSYRKVVDIASTNVGVDTTQALTFAGLTMTDFAAGYDAPLVYTITDTAANGGALVATNWTISACSRTGFTVNRIAAANTSASARVVIEAVHSVEK